MAGCDAPPVLQVGEAVFDPVAPFVEFRIVLDRYLATASRRNTPRNPHIGNGFTEPIRVIASTCQQVLGFWQAPLQRPGADAIAGLSATQEHTDWATTCVHRGMKL